MNFKVKTERDAAYLEYIRQQGCVICGSKINTHAHHTTTGGMGIKGSDSSCVPVCPAHHNQIHATGRKDNIPNLETIINRLRANYKGDHNG